jgi:hypothetical protein
MMFTYAALIAFTAVTFWMIVNDRPANSQTAPSPGVGYTHADLVDDPCPTSNPTCTDHRNQKVPMDWWYPVTDTNGLWPATFKFSDGAGTVYGNHPMTGVHDGGASRIPASRPVIVMAHGTAGHGIQNVSMYRYLASKGYLVAAPTFRGNSLIDVGLGLPIDSFPTTVTKRHLDLSFAINMTTAVFGSSGKVKMVANDPVIATIGHSLGAMDAIGMTTGINPYLLPDARVDATVGISSSVYLWDVVGLDSAALLGSVPKPTLLIDQRSDQVTPSLYTDRVQREIMNADMQPVPLVDRLNLRDARHNATTDVDALKVSLDASTAPQASKDAVTNLAAEVCPPSDTNCVPRVHTRQEINIAGFLDDNLP